MGTMDDVTITRDGKEYSVYVWYDIEPGSGDCWNEPKLDDRFIIEKVLFHGYNILKLLETSELEEIKEQLEFRHCWEDYK